MSYDYDYMIADYEEDSLIIVIGNNYYEYELSQHKDLFEGGKENGVDYEQRGSPEDAEDLQEYTDEQLEDLEDEADRFNFLRSWDEWREW